ncbi:MAG: PIN domain-containing protein [Microcella sp.]|uniref:PIN domain-containing protein n=1 Tax=Microcella sp. TaxID=1913979 RepID=UPI0033151AD1
MDSSALLAYLQGESSAGTVREHLEKGGVVSAANWSEVAQKMSRRHSWSIGRSLLLSFPLQISPVTVDEAEAAAAMWEPSTPLSLADRLCLSLADRLELPALSADRAWFDLPRVIAVR